MPTQQPLVTEPIDGDKKLAEGTADEGTVDEYVAALMLAMRKHATMPMTTKIKLPGMTAGKKMTVDMVHWDAMRHVLGVFFSGGPVNDETLQYRGPRQQAPANEEKPLQAMEVEEEKPLAPLVEEPNDDNANA